MEISQKDLAVLKDLAKKQLEIANSEKMKAIYADWEKHGSFKSESRPMITIETWTFMDDIIPPLMKCEGERAREIERGFLMRLVNHELFDDDTIVPDYIPVGVGGSFVPFGIDVSAEHATDANGESLGHHFTQVLRDLEDDFGKLGKSKMSVDLQAFHRSVNEYNELFGDILPAKLVGGSIVACPTQDIVHIMSMEDMFCSMYDYPELFHKMMEMLTDDYIEMLDMLEKENAVLPTTKEQHLCQGSYCFTDELPDSKAGGFKTSDVWGYMDSQESSGLSPQMYAEFIFPYYEKIAKRFGLFSYGCCEATDPIWESCLSKLDNLRKVSISPWCSEEKMGEVLRGRNIVYLRKPSPNLLGVGSVLDESAVYEHFRKTAQAAKGCRIEVAQRDVYHINNTPDKVKRYVQIARECLGK